MLGLVDAAAPNAPRADETEDIVLPNGTIRQGDALEFLRSIEPQTADVVFLDPPFNLGKRYGIADEISDRIDAVAYRRYMANVLRRAAVILKPGGALYLYHLPRWAVSLAPAIPPSLELRHWIAVAMKNGFARGARLYPAHYALLYYTKGQPTAFARPKVPLKRCRHCKGLLRDYGGYQKFMDKGVNLSDVWDDVSPVRHKKSKHRDSNELPIELLRRVVAISGVPGGLLVDPFVGSGTAIVAAVEAQMSFLAADLDTDYCRIAANRVLTEV